MFEAVTDYWSALIYVLWMGRDYRGLSREVIALAARLIRVEVGHQSLRRKLVYR